MPVSAIIEHNEAEFEEAEAHVTLALCDLLEEAGAGRMTLIELGHPRVMAERAAVIECRQELLWENDFNVRGRILDRERAVRSGMESTLSGEIIKPRTDRSGEPLAPWKDPSTREWPAVH